MRCGHTSAEHTNAERGADKSPALRARERVEGLAQCSTVLVLKNGFGRGFSLRDSTRTAQLLCEAERPNFSYESSQGAELVSYNFAEYY